MVSAPVEECCECEEGTKVYHFATKTCPNCKMAGIFLDKAGIAYEKLYADEHVDLVDKFKVKEAPTLVVVEGDREIAKAANLSNIRKYIDSVTKA